MISDWNKKTPEQKARFVANAKAKRHAKALAEGRIPGQTGAPKTLVTAELRESARLKHNKRTSALALKIRTAKRAAKAIAEGRTPGKPGKKPVGEAERKKLLDAAQKRFRDKHRARLRAYQAEKKREVRATEEGRRKMRQIAVVHGAKRRAQKQNCEGSHTAQDILDLHVKQKGKCTWCLQALGSEKAYHVDHKMPLALGGSNDRRNLQLLHATCNLMKNSKHPADFGMEHGLLAW